MSAGELLFALFALLFVCFGGWWAIENRKGWRELLHPIRLLVWQARQWEAERELERDLNRRAQVARTHVRREAQHRAFGAPVTLREHVDDAFADCELIDAEVKGW